MEDIARALEALVNVAKAKFDTLTEPDVSIKAAPGKWSQKEILGHLIDSAGNNQQKFVRAMQEKSSDFQGYEQDKWVELQQYNARNWVDMIELWALLNKHLAHVIRNIPEDRLLHTIRIDQGEPCTLDFLVRDYIEHTKHHLKQIFPAENI